jgi:hypothetical protein
VGVLLASFVAIEQNQRRKHAFAELLAGLARQDGAKSMMESRRTIIAADITLQNYAASPAPGCDQDDNCRAAFWAD